jgi:hypothetical protein
MTFDHIKILDSLKISLYFHVLDHGKILDSLKTFPFSFSRRRANKAKSTLWQIMSVLQVMLALQKLTLEIQYGLPTYPQFEQGWYFPEVVLHQSGAYSQFGK